MNAGEITAILSGLVVLVGAIAAAAVSVIRALHQNTRVTAENTADRAVKTQATNAKLDDIKEAVSPPAR